MYLRLLGGLLTNLVYYYKNKRRSCMVESGGIGIGL